MSITRFNKSKVRKSRSMELNLIVLIVIIIIIIIVVVVMMMMIVILVVCSIPILDLWSQGIDELSFVF